MSQLRLFINAFQFVYALREEFLQRSSRFGYRWIQHPLNGQIDVQPIGGPSNSGGSAWWFRQIPMPLSGPRRLYCMVALEPLSGATDKTLVVSLAFDLNAETLAVYAYKVNNEGKTEILADTARPTSERQAPQIALKILRRLQEVV